MKRGAWPCVSVSIKNEVTDEHGMEFLTPTNLEPAAHGPDLDMKFQTCTSRS